MGRKRQAQWVILCLSLFVGIGSVIGLPSPNGQEWVEADITNCAVVQHETPYAHGVWLGPWDGFESKTLAPDSNAVYFVAKIPALPKQKYGEAHLIVRGVYPQARFMSFHLYNETFVYRDNLRDVLIAPDNGSYNPFIAEKEGTETTERYTLLILDEDDVLYGNEGTPLKGYNTSNFYNLMLRYYDPARDSGKVVGGVALPRIMLRYRVSEVPDTVLKDPCSIIASEWYGGTQRTEMLNSLAPYLYPFLRFMAGKMIIPGYLPKDDPQFSQPEWIFGGRMECTFNHIIPRGPIAWLAPVPEYPPEYCGVKYTRGAFNFDQRYLYSFLDPRKGSVVIRMKTFSAAEYGSLSVADSVYPDVRYWSLCSVQTENLMYTVGCIKDHEFVRDRADPGYVTIVATTGNPPEGVCDVINGQTENCSYNWLPMPGPVSWLYLRTLAPNENSPNYRYTPYMYPTTSDPNNATQLKEHMGLYYPQSAYCTFDSDKKGKTRCTDVLREFGSSE